MTIDKISLEQLFPTGVFQNIRLRAEATIDESDNITECYKRLQQEVENAFVKLNPQINWGEQPAVQVPEVQKDSRESATEGMLEAINACTSIEVLETFKRLVKNNEVFKSAYDTKLKWLSNGQH